MAHPMFKPRCWALSSTQPLRLTTVFSPQSRLQLAWNTEAYSPGDATADWEHWLGLSPPTCLPGSPPALALFCCGTLDRRLYLSVPAAMCEVGQRRETSNFGLLTAATLQSVLSGCGAGSAGVHWRTGQQESLPEGERPGWGAVPIREISQDNRKQPLWSPTGNLGAGWNAEFV